MRRRIVANAAEFFDIAKTADEQMSEKFTLRLRHPATAECVADQEIQHIDQLTLAAAAK